VDSALAWIGQIAEAIGQFIPRLRIVRTTHGAVKFIRGARAVAVGPGLHWFWPLITDFVEYPMVRQPVNLETQMIESADGRTVGVGGFVVYEVKDLLPLVAQTYSPDETVRDLCLTVIHDVICRKTRDEIRSAQRSGELDRELRREAAAELGKYGVRVLKLTLTNLAPGRVLKVFQSTSKDG
jgi:regulator of protease activity HflC (stomatin/prohibitin superfamily)